MYNYAGEVWSFRQGDFRNDTERMLVDFGRASLLGKAMQQPERVRDALRKVRTDGLAATLSAITDKLDQPLALGYCNAGVVTAAGADVDGIRVGDRVVSNGKHAEYVSVGQNLCARIPDNVPDEDATFAIPAAIGLQGVRLAAPTLGETFVVIGLGLIGLLTVQILVANGCRVIGIDRDSSRAALAATFGATPVPASADMVADVLARTNGIGADGVLICASTSSDEPVAHAAKMSRTRGRIVLVGVAGLSLSRADFYEKELSFQVATDADRTFATLRFAPGFDVVQRADGEIIVSADGIVRCRLTHTGAAARIIDDFHHPCFGMKLPCKLLRVPFLHPTLVTRLSFRTLA